MCLAFEMLKIFLFNLFQLKWSDKPKSWSEITEIVVGYFRCLGRKYPKYASDIH